MASGRAKCQLPNKRHATALCLSAAAKGYFVEMRTCTKSDGVYCEVCTNVLGLAQKVQINGFFRRRRPYKIT